MSPPSRPGCGSSRTAAPEIPPGRNTVYLEQLEARVFDPLWLLSRQWQLGEFQGEDAATPVNARLDYTVTPVSRYSLAEDTGSRDFAGTYEVWADGPTEPPRPGLFEYRLSRLFRYQLPRHFAVADDDMLFVDLRRLFGGAIPVNVAVTWVDAEGDGASHTAKWGEPDPAIPGVDVGELTEEPMQRLQVPAADLDIQGRGVTGVSVSCRPRPGQPLGVTVGPTGRLFATPQPAPPLQVLVDQEPPDERDLQFAVEAGLQFLRMLAGRLAGPAQQRMSAYRAAYATATDPDLALQLPAASTADAPRVDETTRRFIGLMQGRVPDGGKLATALRDNPTGLLTRLEIAEEDVPAVQATHSAWLKWRDAFFSRRAPDEGNPRRTGRLEKHFQVATPETGQEVTWLTADGYTGDLDWYSFDIAEVHKNSPDTALAHGPMENACSANRMLTQMRYPGMPLPRFWEFEDARVDLGSLVAAPGDTATMLVARFAFAYSNDWYRLPLQLDVGTLCRITRLEVTTTIGTQPVEVPAYQATGDQGGTTLYQLSLPGGPATPQLLLTPTLPVTLPRGEVIEQVRFLRDETANLGFAVESTIPNLRGRPRNREEEPRPTSPAITLTTGASAAYRLREDPPRHWLPLVPQSPDGGLLALVGDPAGSILQGTPWLYEEELRHDGLTAVLRYALGRGADGSTFLFCGSELHLGARSASSGIRFDQVLEPPQ